MLRKKSGLKLLLFAAVMAGIIGLGIIMPVDTGYDIKVAVLYSGDSKTYQDIYQQFSQPVLMNLKVEAIDADKLNDASLRAYDMVYPDPSVRNSEKSDAVIKRLINYVASGGSVFLENSFYDWLPKDFLGASSFRKVDELPESLSLPDVRRDLQPIQKLVDDFYTNFKKFRKMEELNGKDFGYGMVSSTATPIVKSGNTAIYTLNQYEKGYVFFTNPLLPNAMYVNGLDMLPKTENQAYFNNMAASADRMLGSEFAAFLSKQKYGYALKRVFGPYGRPAMAWQNHFEVLSAIKDKSIQKWIDIAMEYNEIASYSLARGVYEWGTRYESIGYHLNGDTGSGMIYQTEEEEAFYEASRHAIVDNTWLVQKKCDKSFGFFQNIGDIPDRAYPYVYDMDRDGIADIISGSSDGYFYYYKGLSMDNGWELNKPEKLLMADGTEIKTVGFSAPVLFDIDGNGSPDLITGCSDGRIFWFANNGNFRFEYKGTLVEAVPQAKFSAPDIGDIDEDGVADLIAGMKNGRVYFYKGETKGRGLSFAGGKPLMDINGKELDAGMNAAPRLVDLNGDGHLDIAAGNYDGYIRKFLNNGLAFSDAGYFDDNVMNYLGNRHLKNGNNAVPAFADVNGDKKPDLIVGRLEFGMAVPIDSRWFPYKAELEDALNYVKANYAGIEPHNFSNHFKDSQAEQRELAMHKKAFESYGLQWDNTGTNQHTWKINNTDPVQTILNEYESGLSWNGGAENVNSNMDPAYGTESTWNMPFYLYKDGKATGMMVFAPSPSLTVLHGFYRYSAAWDTPVSYYMHTEYDAVSDPDKLRKTAEFMDQYRTSNDYNFMTEQQMVRSFSAALNTSAGVGVSPVKWLFHAIQNKIRTLKQFEIRISPVVAMDERRLLDGSFREVAGVKVECGEKFMSAPLDTDADIYMRKGNDLYIGLNRPVKVYTSKKPDERPHIVRVNLPVNIAEKDNGINVEFKEGGLQQIKLYLPGSKPVIGSEGWTSVKEQEDMYTLTRFGGPAVLELNYAGSGDGS